MYQLSEEHDPVDLLIKLWLNGRRLPLASSSQQLISSLSFCIMYQYDELSYKTSIVDVTYISQEEFTKKGVVTIIWH